MKVEQPETLVMIESIVDESNGFAIDCLIALKQRRLTEALAVLGLG